MTKALVEIVFDDGHTVVTDAADATRHAREQIEAGYSTYLPEITEVDADDLARLRAAEAEYGAAKRALQEGAKIVTEMVWTEATVEARAKRAYDSIVRGFEDDDEFMRIETKDQVSQEIARCAEARDQADLDDLTIIVEAALEANGFRFTEDGVMYR